MTEWSLLPKAYLHLFLQVVTQHAIQLLYIMLHEPLHSVPTKRLGQILGGNAGVSKLQLQ